MKYTALMFDIIKSRNYQKRYDVQNVLITTITYLNKIFCSEIKKDVVCSAGDEFQGLFLNLQSAFLYVRKLQLLIYPIKIRCGIGYGEIKYDIEDWSSSLYDGEAYYLAREAINKISNSDNNAICFNSSSNYDKYLNSFCILNMELKAEQSQICRWIELLSDIIYPIKKIDENEEIYLFIIKNRCKLIEQEKWNKVKGCPREIQLVEKNITYLFGLIDNDISSSNCSCKLYFDELWKYGMSTNIAQAMNTTRQNIDRYILSGKIKESRMMDKAIYELLGENMWQIL